MTLFGLLAQPPTHSVDASARRTPVRKTFPFSLLQLFRTGVSFCLSSRKEPFQSVFVRPISSIASGGAAALVIFCLRRDSRRYVLRFRFRLI